MHFYIPHFNLPVNQLSNRCEVVAQVQGLDVADGRQAEVQLQRLLPVLASHLSRHGDGLTLALLQPRQVSQQGGTLSGAAAPQQAHAGAHQRRQRAVVVARALKGA